MKETPPLTPEEDAALTAKAEAWLATPDADKWGHAYPSPLSKRIIEIHTARQAEYKAWCDMLADQRRMLALQADLTTLALPVGSLTEERAQVALLAVKEKLSARCLKEGPGHTPSPETSGSSAQSIVVNFTEARREPDAR